jgi:hypothetical protein
MQWRRWMAAAVMMACGSAMACGDDDSMDEGAGESETGGTQSGGDTTSDDAPGGTTGPDADEGSSSDGDPPADTSADGTESGGGEDVYACGPFCETALMCDPDAGSTTQQECVDACVDQYASGSTGPACDAAVLAANQCIAALDCATFNDTMSGACMMEFTALIQACG